MSISWPLDWCKNNWVCNPRRLLERALFEKKSESRSGCTKIMTWTHWSSLWISFKFLSPIQQLNRRLWSSLITYVNPGTISLVFHVPCRQQRRSEKFLQIYANPCRFIKLFNHVNLRKSTQIHIHPSKCKMDPTRPWARVLVPGNLFFWDFPEIFQNWENFREFIFFGNFLNIQGIFLK